MNDRVLADLAGDGDAPPRGERGSTVRAALPLDIPRSPSHDELWDRDAAGQAQPKDGVETDSGTGAEQPESIPSDAVSEALAAYAHPAEEPVAVPTLATAECADARDAECARRPRRCRTCERKSSARTDRAGWCVPMR